MNKPILFILLAVHLISCSHKRRYNDVKITHKVTSTLPLLCETEGNGIYKLTNSLLLRAKVEQDVRKLVMDTILRRSVYGEWMNNQSFVDEIYFPRAALKNSGDIAGLTITIARDFSDLDFYGYGLAWDTHIIHNIELSKLHNDTTSAQWEISSDTYNGVVTVVGKRGTRNLSLLDAHGKPVTIPGFTAYRSFIGDIRYKQKIVIVFRDGWVYTDSINSEKKEGDAPQLMRYAMNLTESHQY